MQYLRLSEQVRVEEQRVAELESKVKEALDAVRRAEAVSAAENLEAVESAVVLAHDSGITTESGVAEFVRLRMEDWSRDRAPQHAPAINGAKTTLSRAKQSLKDGRDRLSALKAERDAVGS